MRRIALLLLAGAPSFAAAQGFGVYEHGTCAMARAGVAAARPCPDGSAIFFNPAGLAGLSGRHASAGVTLIAATGGFTDDILAETTELDNPLIAVPSAYVTYETSPKLTVGLGAYAPYGLEVRWPVEGFEGRFLGYNSKLASIYIQPTVGYKVSERLSVGLGAAYITSHVLLRQRVDLSAQPVPGQTFNFGALGIPHGSDFADAELEASGTGFALNLGAIVNVSDRLSIGGHWLTRKRITYEGDVNFTQIATGLVLPPNNPLGLPGGTSVDALVAASFLPGGPLASGGVSTAITMPPQGTLGFAYDAGDGVTIMADLHMVLWGWFEQLEVDFENPATPDVTLYQGYRDTGGLRMGVEWARTEKLTLRGGYLYHTAAAPPETVTPLLPEGARNEVTLGAGLVLAPRLTADVAYQYIRQNDRRGRVHEATVGNTGLYEFKAHLFGFGLAYTF